jgi:hypothetical protein
VNCKLYVMWLCKSYCPSKIRSLNWQPHPMSMHHYPPFSFTGDWILQNDAFHYWDTTVTCILNMLSKVWVEIWYFWLGFPAGFASIPTTFPSQGGLKIACGSSSGWGVQICPLWCSTKWVLALFTMKAVWWILVSPLWASTLGHIVDGIPCVVIFGLQGISLAPSLKDILGVMGRVVHLGCTVTFSSFWGANLETILPTKTALFIGTPFLYSP